MCIMYYSFKANDILKIYIIITLCKFIVREQWKWYYAAHPNLAALFADIMKRQKSLQHAQDIMKQRYAFITWSVSYGRIPATGWMKNALQVVYFKIINYSDKCTVNCCINR